MRLVLIPLAASMAIATPALAQSATDSGLRADVHGGFGWQDSQQAQGSVGATLGYDIRTGGNTFVGVEQSADKVLTSQDKWRWSTTGRVGANITPQDKLYGLAGYTYGDHGPNATHLGFGIEHDYGPYFTKAEYRHYYTEEGARDTNAATVGFGVHF